MEKCRSKNGPLGNSSINWIFLWRIPIQNHLKLSITKKRRTEAKYLTWNSIWLEFVKKTSMPNLAKSFVSSATARVAPDLLKTLPILLDTTVRRCAVNQEDLKPYWKWEKRLHFSRWSKIILFTSFSKTLLTTERRLTGQ